ncbi:hypothetical protein Tco_0269057 [Tanacetum coccineum]
MFKQLRLEIGLKDALIEMPKFNKWLSSLLRNKEKLEEIAITIVNVECSAIIMNKVPEKLEDPGKFLIPSGLEALISYRNIDFENRKGRLVHAISIIDFSKDDPFSGSTTIPSDAPFPSFSPMKTSDSTFEEFINEFTLPNSLPPGDDVLIYKKDVHEETFSNPLFEFDDNFKSSNVNPLFEENNKDVEIKSFSFPTLTSPEESEFILEEIEEKDSIPPGDLKKDLAVAFDSTESSILPPPLLDSDSPFTAELSASITLNSRILPPRGNEDLNSFSQSRTHNPFSKDADYSLLPRHSETTDECLNFKPILVMKNVVLNEDFYQSKKMLPLNVEDVNSFAFVIWTFLPYFTYTKDSPLVFSFGNEDTIFDPGIFT